MEKWKQQIWDLPYADSVRLKFLVPKGYREIRKDDDTCQLVYDRITLWSELMTGQTDGKIEIDDHIYTDACWYVVPITEPSWLEDVFQIRDVS